MTDRDRIWMAMVQLAPIAFPLCVQKGPQLVGGHANLNIDFNTMAEIAYEGAKAMLARFEKGETGVPAS